MYTCPQPGVCCMAHSCTTTLDREDASKENDRLLSFSGTSKENGDRVGKNIQNQVACAMTSAVPSSAKVPIDFLSLFSVSLPTDFGAPTEAVLQNVLSSGDFYNPSRRALTSQR